MSSGVASAIFLLPLCKSGRPWSQQDFKRPKSNQRTAADVSGFQFSLLDECPNGRIAEPTNLSSGGDGDRQGLQFLCSRNVGSVRHATHVDVATTQKKEQLIGFSS